MEQTILTFSRLASNHTKIEFDVFFLNFFLFTWHYFFFRKLFSLLTLGWLCRLATHIHT